jgi:Transmembrane protein 138
MLVATYLFQVGLVTVLVSEFKLFSFIALAYLIALLAYGGEKMVRLFLSPNPWTGWLTVGVLRACCTLVKWIG